MSLSFDATNDLVSITTNPGAVTVSVAAWLYPLSMGESNAGKVVSLGTSNTAGLRFNGTGASNKLQWNWEFTGNDGRWDFTTALTLSAWNHVVVTYDPASATNDPVFYLNGVLDTTVETATPTLSPDTPSGATIIGNNNATAQTWDGLIGEWAMWSSKLLTASEAAAVCRHGVLSISTGLYAYLPMDNTGSAQATDLSGNGRNGSITGAVVGENPPIRPAGRRG